MKAFLKKVTAALGYEIVNVNSRRGVSWKHDLKRVALLNEFKICFDVGANQGDFTAELSELFPFAQIHAFEPCGQTFRRLSHRYERSSRVNLVNAAVGDEAGTAVLRTYSDSAKNTLSADLRDSMRSEVPQEERVEILRLEDYCRNRKVEIIDLLKIDVEGHEAAVLKGAGELLDGKRIRYVYFEFHRVSPLGAEDAHTNLVAVDRLLEEKGYTLCSLYTQGIHLDEPIGTFNALYRPRSFR